MAAVASPLPKTAAHRNAINEHEHFTLDNVHHNVLPEAKLQVSHVENMRIGTETNRPAAGLDIFNLDATHLISSPYPQFENQLNLQGLETPYKLFAFALTALQPIREDYATAPYLESFNWSEVFSILRALCKQTGYQWQEQGFYTVIFRSTLQAGIDRERLGLLDRMSHEEACASGGLLKYYFGTCDQKRQNLATCLWRSREEARAGGGGPWHAQARAAARTMYEKITFHIHELVVEDGAHAWRLEEFK